jgi:hypothetical protein
MRHVALFVLLGGCRSLLGIDEPVPLSPDAAPADGGPDGGDATFATFQLQVQALVDGRSQLVIQDGSVRWRHFSFAAPGRSGFLLDPTSLDGMLWFPTWPDLPTTENRDCNCMSSETQLPTPLPRLPSTATVTATMSRRDPIIAQQAAESNGYTLIVELSDEDFGGAGNQTVEITVSPK